MTTRLNRRRMDADDSLGANPLTRAPLVSRFHSGNRRSSNKKIIDRIPRSYDQRERGRGRNREREKELSRSSGVESEREISNGRWNGLSSSELLRDKVGDRYLWVTGYVKANHTCVPPRSITSSITNRDKLPTIFLFNGSYGYIIVSTKRYVASVPVLFLPTSHTRVSTAWRLRTIARKRKVFLPPWGERGSGFSIAVLFYSNRA